MHDSPSNMLILSGRASNIRRLVNIIQDIDSPDASHIDIVPLRYALAMDVVNTVKTLIEGHHASINTRTATISADDKSNAVLISGSKADRLRIRLLINQLDKRDKYGNSDNTQLIYLHYLRAQDLAPVLAGIAKANFSGEVGTTIGTITTPVLDTSTPTSTLTDQGDGSSGSQGGEQQSTASSSPSNLSSNTQATSSSSAGDAKPKIQIIAEPNTNSIIISGPVTVIRTLRQIISRLDIRPAQVLVEALIAEINEDDVNQLGLEWGTVSPSGDKDSGITFTQGFAILNNNTRLADFQARLYALVTQQRANILSTPSVVVLDNRQAKILVGKQVSIQDSTYPNNAGGQGVANPYTTFTRQNVALHLYVRPQISIGSGIQLQIDHGNDTLASDTDPTSGRPVVNTSSILTSVLVKSGDILVLGGLTQNGLEHTSSHVPIIGEIPGIGRVFQNHKRQRNNKVLMVFIRPIILESEKTGLQVTGSKYYELRNEQLNWLRKEPYHPKNQDIVIKNLQSASLPRPFNLPGKTHGRKY